MPTHTIRYRTHPDRTDENMRLVEAVFAELRESPLPGVVYSATCTPDGWFTHVVTQDEGGSQLMTLASFRRFQEGIRARCVEAPVRTQETLLGRHG